jgi:hypothetical protein
LTVNGGEAGDFPDFRFREREEGDEAAFAPREKPAFGRRDVLVKEREKRDRGRKGQTDFFIPM